MTAEIMEFIGKTDKNGNTARLRVEKKSVDLLDGWVDDVIRNEI